MKYLFLVSWLRAREKKLTDNVDIDRMIGATSMEDSFRVLNDTDYAPYISSESYEDLESVIKKEREGFKKELSEIGLEKNTLDILFFRDDLDAAAKKVKEIMSLEKKEQQDVLQQESELVKEIANHNPPTPRHADDVVLSIYFKKTLSFLKKEKESELVDFFKKYQQTLVDTSKEDIVKRDEFLLQLEEELIDKSKALIQGVAPLLAFFIKKRRAEHQIRVVLSSKRIGILSTEVYNLIKRKRAL